jgi:rhodanese-related sulfurtransferase
MDTASAQDIPFLTSSQLALRIGRAGSPLVLDVRSAPAFDTGARLIAGALRLAPDQVQHVADALPQGRDIVAYCVHGHEVSQGTARTLRAAGRAATFLQGGIADWLDAGLPTMAKAPGLGLPALPGTATRWITRERPKIDRIACPWLIRRFVDPSAEFLYVAAGDVIAMAQSENAIPYDVPGVRISHRGPEGELCSFDALMAECGLDDPCLAELARIVRGADTGKPELTPQSPGLMAISLGLSVNFPDDHAMLEQGMVMYDALYAWIKSARAEAHNADLFKKS